MASPGRPPVSGADLRGTRLAQLIRKLKDRELQRHDIVTTETRIGRDETNDIAIDNPGISRHHASVRWNGREFLVTDEGSQNGLFVNGQKATTWTLRDGDAIQVGKFELVFTLSGGRAPASLPPRDGGPAVGKVRNPLPTVAVTAEDVKRIMAEAESRSRASSADTGSSEAPPNLRAGGTNYKGVAIGLGLLVIALIGVTVYLIVNR